MAHKKDDKQSDQQYEVGYRKPPTATQFKKGQSGNPKGRPAGKSNFATALARAMNEKVTVVENGQRRTISKLDAAVKQLINKAASGDLRAFQQMVSLNSLVAAEDGNAAPTILNQDADNQVMAQLLARFQPDSGMQPERVDDANQDSPTPTRRSPRKSS